MIKPKKEKKKLATLHGSLIAPLSIGCPAVFTAGGAVYRTSSVVAVHQVTGEKACFETKNTNYCLFLAPYPLAAIIPSKSALCA